MLDIVMHSVILFVLVNPPLSACERRSCRSRLSDWLHTGSIQFDKSGRKRQWRRYANGKTLEQNASIGHVPNIFIYLLCHIYPGVPHHILCTELNTSRNDVYRSGHVPKRPARPAPRNRTVAARRGLQRVRRSRKYINTSKFPTVKVAIFYGIVLIPLVSLICPFRCTLSLYWQCVYVHSVTTVQSVGPY